MLKSAEHRDLDDASMGLRWTRNRLLVRKCLVLACRYDPAIQRATADLARHYATTILPGALYLDVEPASRHFGPRRRSGGRSSRNVLCVNRTH